jgi:2,4-didehydro-3-deoxy-L-rhamnonate hydrolase
MKLLRFGEKGNEKPGIELDGKWLDCSTFGEDWSEEFFENQGLERLKTWIDSNVDKLQEINKKQD